MDISEISDSELIEIINNIKNINAKKKAFRSILQRSDRIFQNNNINDKELLKVIIRKIFFDDDDEVETFIFKVFNNNNISNNNNNINILSINNEQMPSTTRSSAKRKTFESSSSSSSSSSSLKKMCTNGDCTNYNNNNIQNDSDSNESNLNHNNHNNIDNNIQSGSGYNNLNSNHNNNNSDNNSIIYNLNDAEIIDTAFKCRIITYKIKNKNKNIFNIKQFFESIRKVLIELIENEIKNHTALKINFVLYAKYTKPLENEYLSDSVKTFNTSNSIYTQSTDCNKQLDYLIDHFKIVTEEFQEKGSGWALEEILHILLNINKYNPLRACSFIPLPIPILRKNAIINVRNNNDQECFKWAILSGLHLNCKIGEKSDVNSYKQNCMCGKQLDFDNLNYPMDIKKIPLFEEKNDVSINVFALNEKLEIVGPLHHTKQRKMEHFNLLCITNEENGDHHYCYIKNMSALVSKQISKNTAKKHICDGCLLYFASENTLVLHQNKSCSKIKTVLPEEGAKLKFINWERTMKVPFVVYADFETLLTPLSSSSSSSSAATINTALHVPYSFSYYIKCSYNDELSSFHQYRGNNCASEFVIRLRSDLIDIYNNHISRYIPMKPLSDSQNLSFSSANICHICLKCLEDIDKVKDHCHLTGEYRGAAHNLCNLNLNVPKFIPIFFHNLSGYDIHLFIKEMWLHKFQYDKLEAIPLTTENYISISLKICIRNIPCVQFLELRFLDSFRFLQSSLDNLAKGLEKDEFVETIKAFKPISTSCIDLVLRKGVLPYEYIDSFSKLDEAELPPIDKFFSTLSNKHISVEDYTHAQKVWKCFNVKNLGEYSDIYLKIDVFLLTDIFEQFRSICLELYKLDPAHYYTLPGFSWGAMLKYTEIELDLITDIEMLHFIKNGIRGGISQCSKRYAKANNQYMKDFDSSQPSTFLMYFDANNLYGWAMSQPLPYGNFQWLSELEIQSLDIINLDSEVNTGYILEVDLEYPQTLHDLHNDYPFCAEKMIPPTSKAKITKLIPNLYDKKNYIIHYCTLKQCLQHGLKLKLIHRVLKFNQSDWLKKYIDLNNIQRAATSNRFKQDLFKLNNNAAYGKTFENPENYRKIKFCNRWSRQRNSPGANELISNPKFMSTKIIDESLVIIEMQKSEVLYNKPFYLGFCILEISKSLMYKFHYDYMKKKFPNKINLLYTDTDSFVYEIQSENFYTSLINNPWFDTSAYSSNNKYNIPLINKKKLGLFKDENNGNIVIEFVGLRSKLYSMRIVSDEDEKILKKAKGVGLSAIQDQITFDDYKSCLFEKLTKYCTFQKFSSVSHTIVTQNVTKKALNSEDDKRYLVNNSNETLAWGHFKIQNN